jgi:hypothetical protein
VHPLVHEIQRHPRREVGERDDAQYEHAGVEQQAPSMPSAPSEQTAGSRNLAILHQICILFSNLLSFYRQIYEKKCTFAANFHVNSPPAAGAPAAPTLRT